MTSQGSQNRSTRAGKGQAQARALLRAVGQMHDEDIDLAETALALATLSGGDTSLAPYRRHLTALSAAVAKLTAGRAPEALMLEECLDALRGALVDRMGYEGDSATYEDLQNANLARVIDRRRGLPVALGILYMHAARAQGWRMVGLNFPGHFLIRLDHGGDRAIIDPFGGGRVLSVVDLRDLIKQTSGAAAELEPDHYAPVGNRDVLLRLHNNVKLLHMRGERPDLAAEAVEAMLLMAPGQVPLWRESGLLQAQLGHITTAISAFETFLDLGARAGTSAQLLDQAATLVQHLRNRLN
ncbi:regulator of sirC expression with transglutaminase-like and TPR domain [Nitrospirillum amazonense]|uniref:Regulator of sirC expression with transglutaminase-like and TPR domain n=1 Tax=Nitrospirillum amazonense TaxID=28077 RepID=A0A560FLQ7_9PROT|nr:transglutaminase-like domain-containing protein [Nitrospirillum amazonense]TWB22554.1 regulator of sirC expression with transglutaminase-like and TPR domain [Nitrospirillum amazonense]